MMGCTFITKDKKEQRINADTYCQAGDMAQEAKCNLAPAATLAPTPLQAAEPALVKPPIPKTPSSFHGTKAAYVMYLRDTIQANIEARPSLPSHPVAQVEVRTASNGRITSFSLVHSSGVEEWDKSVLQALTRTKSLPRDHDGQIPAWLELSFPAP